MKAALYFNNRDIRIEEVPIPKISEKEVLVKIYASGVCGSDTMEWYRLHKAPLILGHEIAGEIVEAGKSVKNYKIGDRVVIAHHVPCDNCYFCMMGHHTVCNTLRKTNFDPGGFCEYVRVPEINVEKGIFILPDTISYEEGSFVEPLACVVRAQRITRIQPGTTVLVFGSGIAGLMHIMLAKALGGCNIIAVDISEFRINAALRFGAFHAFHANDFSIEKLKEYNHGRRADLVILCTGAIQAIEFAFKSVEAGGTLMIFAPSPPNYFAQLDFNELFWRNEISILSSYAGAPIDYYTALQLIVYKNLKVKDLITHRLPLHQIIEAFKLVTEAQSSIKVILEPWGPNQ